MSRCQYCRCEVPGLATLCDKCFEAGYDRVVNPKPWRQRIDTLRGLYVFLFVFCYGVIMLQVNRDLHATMVDIAAIAFVLAALLTVIVIASRDPRKPRQRIGMLYIFLLQFAYFFFRLWSHSSYHPFPHPVLFPFVVAAIAGLVEGARGNPRKGSAA
jgi:drug/metabolite transporter (DMT)-like permease